MTNSWTPLPPSYRNGKPLKIHTSIYKESITDVYSGRVEGLR